MWLSGSNSFWDVSLLSDVSAGFTSLIEGGTGTGSCAVCGTGWVADGKLIYLMFLVFSLYPSISIIPKYLVICMIYLFSADHRYSKSNWLFLSKEPEIKVVCCTFRAAEVRSLWLVLVSNLTTKVCKIDFLYATCHCLSVSPYSQLSTNVAKFI